jgi:hypothetical protein
MFSFQAVNIEGKEMEVLYNDVTGSVVEREVLNFEDGLKIYRLKDSLADMLRPNLCPKIPKGKLVSTAAGKAPADEEVSNG